MVYCYRSDAISLVEPDVSSSASPVHDLVHGRFAPFSSRPPKSADPLTNGGIDAKICAVAEGRPSPETANSPGNAQKSADSGTMAEELSSLLPPPESVPGGRKRPHKPAWARTNVKRRSETLSSQMMDDWSRDESEKEARADDDDAESEAVEWNEKRRGCESEEDEEEERREPSREAEEEEETGDWQLPVQLKGYFRDGLLPDAETWQRSAERRLLEQPLSALATRLEVGDADEMDGDPDSDVDPAGEIDLELSPSETIHLRQARPRRSRTTFTTYQLHTLESAFAVNHYP
ncbi:unnamed protein product, partial [Protopolystoma xenopodis]